MRDLWLTIKEAMFGRYRDVGDWLTRSKHARRAAAATRIGIGLSVAGLLLENASTRETWVGQASVWASPARQVSRFPEIALLRDASPDILTLLYGITLLAAIAFAVGWFSKAANIVLLIGFIAIVGQNPMVDTQGDTMVRIALMWMLLIRTSDVWAIDAIRRSRNQAKPDAKARSWDSEEVLPAWLGNGLHNIGVLSLAVQTALIYLASGLDKVAEPAWQHGTALYGTLQLPKFRTFAGLADVLSQSQVMLALLTYSVLLTQLFFVPLLLNRWGRRVAVSASIVLNVFFGIVLATPWASLAVIAVTFLFVSDDAWEEFDERVRYSALADWLADRWFAVYDFVDDIRYRLIIAPWDELKFKILRR